jgi:protein-disulfide isomerase
MMLKRTRHALVAALTAGLLMGASASAFAQAKAADADLAKAIKSLQDEIASLKGEVQKVQADQAKILKKLDTLEGRQAQRPPQQRQQRPVDTTVYDIEVGSSPTLGPENAKVTIVEFVCLQCPYCVREYPKLQQVLKDYPNDVRVVFKHFPLRFHKKAKPAHAACALAGQLGGNEMFWKVHDLIMANPKKLDVPDLRKHFETAGLDLNKFDEVMADEAKIDALVMVDQPVAKKCGVRGTPSVYINGLKLADRKPEGYKARIDEVLKGKKQG